MRKKFLHPSILIRLLLLIVCLSGCLPAEISTSVPGAPLLTTPSAVTRPISTAPPVPAQTPALLPTRTAAASPSARFEFSAWVPAQLRAVYVPPPGIRLAGPAEDADMMLEFVAGVTAPGQAIWVYALAGPFATLLDGVSGQELKRAWRGEAKGDLAGWQLWMSAETRAVFTGLWGSPGDVQIADEADLLARVWPVEKTLAILPFDRLEPRWKVLRVNGLSPLDRGLYLPAYPLAAFFGLKAKTGATTGSAFPEADWVPITNRDEEKLTTLILTGVTALTRGTAEQMDTEGVSYPAENIGDKLRTADLTHISNEVSFYANCPEKRDARFCSQLGYRELLQTVGADVIELTGNHLLDWGPQPFLDTLSIYDQNGMAYYGGGTDALAARAALKITDHGNRLAFLGCNTAGPESVWAADDQPGVARCDFPWLQAEIAALRAEGWLVVVTFQHIEVCQFEPHQTQRADFGKPAVAGAQIVSGSQAHCPQAAAFTDDTFIHYGLGNLFFDQMDPVARRQIIDRHVFYNGRYISTELLTTILEDHSRPRWMTSTERRKLLEDVFRASGWMK